MAYASGLSVAYLPAVIFEHIGEDLSAYSLNGYSRPWDQRIAGQTPATASSDADTGSQGYINTKEDTGISRVGTPAAAHYQFEDAKILIPQIDHSSQLRKSRIFEFLNMKHLDDGNYTSNVNNERIDWDHLKIFSI